jgi:hypothetical protein
MTVYDEKLNEVLSIYEKMSDLFKSELDSSPDGKLIYQNNGQYKQFIHLINENGKRIRKGINTNSEMIKALARKEFNSKALKIFSNNIAALRRAIDRQIPFDPDQILQSMTKAYALLPEEYFFDREKLIIAEDLDDDLLIKVKRHEAWWKKPYKEYWGYPEKKEKRTSRGQKVRSVSEMLIAEALYKYSIPFHYEEELEVDGKTFAPDFTFEGSDYRPFYLDYFGMMDNAKYAKRNIIKLADYYDIGLIPGDNLIVVFDSKGIMNAAVIEAIIKNEIIPRL